MILSRLFVPRIATLSGQRLSMAVGSHLVSQRPILRPQGQTVSRTFSITRKVATRFSSPSLANTQPPPDTHAGHSAPTESAGQPEVPREEKEATTERNEEQGESVRGDPKTLILDAALKHVSECPLPPHLCPLQRREGWKRLKNGVGQRQTRMVSREFDRRSAGRRVCGPLLFFFLFCPGVRLFLSLTLGWMALVGDPQVPCDGRGDVLQRTS